jgi:peptide/nickel transport system permease protein
MAIAISFATFAMVYLAPGDVAVLMAGPRANPAQVEQLRQKLGLDQPFLVQYLEYLGRVVTGDFGTTIAGSPVLTVIATNIGPTAALVSMSVVFSLAITWGLATLAARTPGGAADRIVRLIASALIGMPSFWFGIMLLLFVALPTGMFSIGGWPSTSAEQFRALVLPSLALSVTVIPVLVRGLRSSLIVVARSEYVLVGKAMGVSGSRLARRYVTKNAIVPIIPLVAGMLGVLIGSTAVVEATFGLPGLGQALVGAAMQREASLVQGITLIIGLTVIIIQLAADIALNLLDPRVSMS